MDRGFTNQPSESLTSSRRPFPTPLFLHVPPGGTFAYPALAERCLRTPALELVFDRHRRVAGVLRRAVDLLYLGAPPETLPEARHVILLAHHLPASGTQETVGGTEIALHQRIPPFLRPGLHGFLRRAWGHGRASREGHHRPRQQHPAHPAHHAFPSPFPVWLRRKTSQVDSPRQTKSKGFYNTVSFLQQLT